MAAWVDAPDPRKLCGAGCARDAAILFMGGRVGCFGQGAAVPTPGGTVLLAAAVCCVVWTVCFTAGAFGSMSHEKSEPKGKC